MEEYKTHKALNDKTTALLESSSRKVVCKLGKILQSRGITQKELSEMTGIRQASIYHILHDTKHTVNKNHMLAIMIVLGLTDITEMYEVVFDNPEEKEKIEQLNQLPVHEAVAEDMETILHEKRD